MRRFFLWLTGQPSYEQQTITRLLDMYERVVDSALKSQGLDGVTEDKGEKQKSLPLPHLDDVFDEDEVRRTEERAEIEEYAARAANNPELFGQALFNSIPGNHPQSERWKQVVKRAEEMKVLVS